MSREKWIKVSAELGVVQLVEEKGDRKLYVTHAKEYDSRASMYHVWEGDKWLYCRPDYNGAVKCLNE